MTSLSADPANTIPGLGLCRYIATLVMRWAEPAVHFSRRALPGTQNRTRGGVRRKESALPSSRKIRRYWIGEKIPVFPPSLLPPLQKKATDGDQGRNRLFILKQKIGGLLVVGTCFQLQGVQYPTPLHLQKRMKVAKFRRFRFLRSRT